MEQLSLGFFASLARFPVLALTRPRAVNPDILKSRSRLLAFPGTRENCLFGTAIIVLCSFETSIVDFVKKKASKHWILDFLAIICIFSLL
jgi:hypothetical protein